jgi:parallel beta-helix repeat protein
LLLDFNSSPIGVEKLRRAVSSIMIALLFLSLFVFTFTAISAEAQAGTVHVKASAPDDPIYILANGTVSPKTAPIKNNGNITYTFTDNIVNNSIVVQRNSIIIDGQGYTIQGNGTGAGIELNTRKNVTIKNTRIEAFMFGVDLGSSSNCTVIGNTITNNQEYGVNIWYSSNCTIFGNTLANNIDDSIYVTQFSDYNTISKNNMTKGYYGIELYYSSNDNTVSGNNIANNTQAAIRMIESSNCTFIRNSITNSIEGLVLSKSYNCTILGNIFKNDGLIIEQQSFGNVVVNNLVNNKPLVYLENVSDYTVSDAGQVVLVNSDRIVVKNLDLSNTDYGLQVWQTRNTVITNNRIMNDEWGVYLNYSINSIVSENNVTNNSFGFEFEEAHNCTIYGNDVSNCSMGLDLYRCSNCTMSGNNIVNSNYFYGMGLGYSSNCTVAGNIIRNNTYYGVYIDHSSGNRLFHNNFINNTQQIEDIGNASNVWDDGYPSGGNYWSNYTGSDNYYGSNQDLQGGDSIGDTAYTIDANNADKYPLMGSFSTFNAGTWNGETFYVDTISESNISNFNFNPYTAPQPTLSFNVTGKTGITGFCRVAIPTSLMWCNMPSQWIVIVGGTLYSNQTIISPRVGNYTYIYFTYTHSTKQVQIQSISAVPEFQRYLLLPLFIMVTLLGTVILKRKRRDLYPSM